MPAKTIIRIFGFEPMRENEFPSAFIVGTPIRGTEPVSKIEPRQDYRGDHAIGWFDVYVGDQLVASMNERAVAEVHYEVQP
jgi:hypothetical protein